MKLTPYETLKPKELIPTQLSEQSGEAHLDPFALSFKMTRDHDQCRFRRRLK